MDNQINRCKKTNVSFRYYLNCHRLSIKEKEKYSMTRIMNINTAILELLIFKAHSHSYFITKIER